jgi:murein DD-endopeptidase MepM/ murein hydrolase activator NlpD
LAQHRLSRSSVGTSTIARRRWFDPEDADITDVIPIKKFGSLDGSQILRAPELDDLHDTDKTPLRLLVPPEFLADPAENRHENVTDAPAARGLHRKEPTPAGAVKGRLLFAAMATGAAAAAAHSAVHSAKPSETVLAADSSATRGATIETTSSGVQLVTVRPAVNTAVHSEELANAAAFAQERADREARLKRPLFVQPARGIFTSGFGYRWGVLHGGIDIANSIGTPILAASDGVVVDAGPAAGFGLWVKVRHADGTVTLYGHVNTITCSIGQRVMAGDQIATMGNRGDSTGPHLHFEVLLGGTNRTDPVPWLAERGISVGASAG